MQLELPHQSEERENPMHYSQPQRYIISMLQLFSQLLVFETHLDSYFYDPHFDSYFLFHSTNFAKFILQLSCKLRFYVVSAFFQVLSIQLLYMMLCCVQDTTLTLYIPRHGKITAIPNNMEHCTSFAINGVTFINSRQFMLSSRDKFFSNLSKDQFREIFRVILRSTTKSATNQ